MDSWIRVKGTLVRGHGVASGQADDARFPDGTIRLQLPLFRDVGIDLSGYHPATLNVSIAPLRFEPRCPKFTAQGVRWFAGFPPEDFSFFSCRITAVDGRAADGLIYYPHPETKPDHFQNESVLEVLAPFLEGVEYGDAILLDLREDEMAVS